MVCEAMLQNIIKGMAAIGSNTCRRMAPAAAENAKPENPLTKPPRKTAVDSIASFDRRLHSRPPGRKRELAVDAGRQLDLSSTRPLRCGVECVHAAVRRAEPPRSKRCAVASLRAKSCVRGPRMSVMTPARMSPALIADVQTKPDGLR